jgi:NAD+ diphosphatase
LTLARGTYDRAADRRLDEQWLGQVWSGQVPTRMFVVHQGKAAVTTGSPAELVFQDPAALQGVEGVRAVLGIDDGVTYLGLLLPSDSAAPELPEAVEGEEVVAGGLRELGGILGDRDSSLLVSAVALANWHAGHSWCPRCGAPTQSVQGGWARHCDVDNTDHFPRNDPAVIVLVLDDQDRALLGNRVGWPATTYSTLAGFVEAGESAEMTVIREMAEEAGVRIDAARIDYLGSQPWPFPSSLMFGYHAYIAEDSPPAKGDGEEIATARWFTRDELAAACKTGEVVLPGIISIARRLIEHWYGAELPGVWT